MGIDFKNDRGVNLSDSKFDKDAVNFRTLKRAIGEVQANSVFATVSGITAGNNISITGSTSAITISLTGSVYTQAVTAASVSGTSVFGETLYSGITNLESVIYNIVTGTELNDITRVQPGYNIVTGGTGNFPIVSVIGSPNFSGTGTFVGLSASTISGGTIFSGSTDLETVIYSIVTGTELNDITRIQNGLNTYTGGTPNAPTVNISALTIDNIFASGSSQFLSISGTSISASTFFSGSTDLSTIFQLAGAEDITRVQNGLNTYTGGTANSPTINVSGLTIDNILVSGSTIFSSLSATTLSGGTIYSGVTELSSLFVLKPDQTRVQPGYNITTGGTQNFPAIHTIGSPNFSGTGTFVGLSATTISANTLFVSSISGMSPVRIESTFVEGDTYRAGTISGGTFYSGSTELGSLFSSIFSSTNDITRIQPGYNIVTGGTGNFPVVGVIGSPNFSGQVTSVSLSSTTISGETVIVGTTPITLSIGQLNVAGTGGSIFERNDNNDLDRSALVIQRTKADATALGAGCGANISYNLEAFTSGTMVTTGRISNIWEVVQTNDTTARDSAMIFYTILDNTLSEKVRISSAGYFGINSTAPASMFEMNGAGAASTDFFRMRQPNVAHGMTAVVPTDVYGYYGWTSSSTGGLGIVGLTDADGIPGITLNGIVGTTTPTIEAVSLRGFKKNGTTTQALASTEILAAFRNSGTVVSTMFGNGDMLWGYSTLASSESWGFQKSGNSASQLAISNQASGTAARANLVLSNSATLATVLSINTYSSGYTTAGMSIADSSAIASSKPAGFQIGTSSQAPFSLWSGNIQRITLDNVNGYVGIGETSPSSLLDIKGTGTTQTIDGIRLQQPNVAHGMTSILPTDVYGLVSWSSAAAGGLIIGGFSDTDALGLQLVGTNGGTSPATAGIELRSRKKNGTTVQALAATEPLVTFLNHTTEAGRILANGDMLLGSSSKSAAESWGFYKNQNAATYSLVSNTTSGSLGSAFIVASIHPNIGSQTSIASLSSGYTPIGLLTPDTGVLYGNMNAGLNVGTANNSQLSLWTSNVKRIEIDASGNTSFSGVTRALSLSATTLSGGTIYSGTTPLSQIIQTIALGSAFGNDYEIQLNSGDTFYSTGSFTYDFDANNFSAGGTPAYSPFASNNSVLSSPTAIVGINTTQSIIAGGSLNNLTGTGSTIFGGLSNSIAGSFYSSIIGGKSNVIPAGTTGVTIVSSSAMTGSSSYTLYADNIITGAIQTNRLTATTIVNDEIELAVVSSFRFLTFN